MGRLLEKEFGPKKIRGVILGTDSIFVNDLLIFTDPVIRDATNPVFLKKLSQLFLSMLQDQEMRPHLDLILVSTRFHVSPRPEVNRKRRIHEQNIARSIMESMYQVEPSLTRYYGIFAATALPVPRNKNKHWVEFRIIRSEHMHIELMKSLKKYFF
jgi:hypothetical protein